MSGRLIIFGIDGLSAGQWRALAESGSMPFSAKLLGRGKLVPMHSSIPEVSSVAWASIVTGVNPGLHNIFGFTDLIPGSYILGFTSARTFKASPFWCREDGKRNLIINVPQSYPALPMQGTLVSGFVALDLEKGVYPPEMLPLLREEGYVFDVEAGLARENKDRFYEELGRVLDIRHRVLNRLMDKEAWDRLMFVVTGTDRLNHHCWRDFEDATSPFHGRYHDFHRKVDEVLEDVCGRMGPEDTLVVVSDHGFEGLDMSVNVNRILLDHGYLVLDEAKGPYYRAIRPEAGAFAMDPGRVYLHRASRFPAGSVKEKEADRLVDELEEFFSHYRVQGKRIVREVRRGRSLYEGPHAAHGPDLVLMPETGIALSGGIQTEELVEATGLQGKHTWSDAVFFHMGPRSLELPKSMGVEDVLPVLEQGGCL